MSNNENFVASYLMAVKSLISNDGALIGVLPDMIFELSSLLFAPKPLMSTQMNRVDELLKFSVVASRLSEANRTIVKNASGKVATKLLSFISGSRQTQDHFQLAQVCMSLRKPGESVSPVHDQALRRAAAWGKLLELKVLIRSMSMSDLNKTDATRHLSALHWTAIQKNIDCAKMLIHAGAYLDLQDKNGKTALHYAVEKGDRAMIKLLVDSGASPDLTDGQSHTPEQCTTDLDLKIFIKHCCHQPVHESVDPFIPSNFF